MTATRLATIDGEIMRPQKSAATTASTTFNLSTSEQIPQWDGQSWVAVGNAPSIGAVIAWTHSTGATLSVRVWLSNDSAGTVATKAPYIPASATGTTPAYPQLVTFAKADWVEGAATVTYCPVQIDATGFRFWKLGILANAAAGSVIVHIGAGTN